MFPLSTLKASQAQFPCIPVKQTWPSQPSLQAPLPPPRSPAWFSRRGSWQRSKLVNTLLSSSVDFALWLLTLCPANSLRPKFLCVKRRANRLRGRRCQTDSSAVLCRVPPSASALSNQLWALAACPPVTEADIHVLLFCGVPFFPALVYHRDLTATATSYLSVQRDNTSLDI